MHPSIDINFSTVFFTALLGIFVSGILFFKNRGGSLHARLLAGYLFSVSVISLFSAAYHTDIFLRYPHLARSMVFLSMCSSPFAFLYVRSVLQQEYALHRRDLLLFIPALLYTANMVPFYLMPWEEKRALIERMLADRSLVAREPEGVLPEGWGILFRMAFGLALATAQFTMVLRWRQRILNTADRRAQNVDTYKWLFFFSLLVAMSFLILLVEYVFQVSQFVEIYRLITFTMSASVLFTCIYLLVRPNILYGMSGWLQTEPVEYLQEKRPEDAPPVAAVRRQTLSKAQEKEFRALLEDHFRNKQPFLRQGYRINELSEELKIPNYQLSAFINQEFGKNFNELVNEYRVLYLKDLMDKDPNYRQQYTLEAMGRMAGFNSRTSFISAVKKLSGKTPLEYFGPPA
jgi:AraC-like DNA-binding protein